MQQSRKQKRVIVRIEKVGGICLKFCFRPQAPKYCPVIFTMR